ncbi:class I SAM-dependent methyltransferase [Dyella sp.]|jgi:16S rRNA (guanine1207-N2)-methyltransferase|uniref:class I SAM-dependent methyltransferase n=1 Tax=Dyella sp. TaxID=1869338 RepID=UPI002D784D0A|nr:methyltransferase [Dyella sp.]HET6431281.1 methyltransferase [Dyella sp.]
MPVAAAPVDEVLDALFMPLTEGILRLPADARVLFLRARDSFRLREVARPGWRLEQSFKPFADALERSRFHVDAWVEGELFDLVLVLPPRQRDEAHVLFARAVSLAAPGGMVLACVPNAEGARSAQSDLAALAGQGGHLSKHKCRVFWTGPLHGAHDHALHADWLAFDAPRRNAAGYWSRPGLFAWDRVDAASALLAAHLPHDLAGDVADLGAGYGYLGSEVIARCPGVTALDGFEAEQRALACAGENLAEAQARAGRDVAVALHWHDVTTGLPGRYHAIVSNPPFHQGRADQPELGRAFIAAAAAALTPGGQLWLVANRHLPYEATLAARFDEVHPVADEGGFKVISARGAHA